MNTSKKAIPALLAAALLALGGISAAQAADTMTGAYAGINLGAPDYKSTINGVSGGGSGLGGKIYGGYQFNQNFALEAGLVDLGHVDDSTGRVKTRGSYFDAVGMVPVADKVSLTGSVGVADGHFDTNMGSDSHSGLKLGVGAQYQVTEKVALVGQYNHYHFDDVFDSKATIGEFSVGVKMGF